MGVQNTQMENRDMSKPPWCLLEQKVDQQNGIPDRNPDVYVDIYVGFLQCSTPAEGIVSRCGTNRIFRRGITDRHVLYLICQKEFQTG